MRFTPDHHHAPFPHVIIDDAFDVAPLRARLDDEDAELIVSEIFEVMATAELPALAEALMTRDVRDELARLAGVGPVSRCTMRGYAYGPGHYLLPHADCDADRTRLLAYSLYVSVSDDLVGGELDLFADNRTLVKSIPPRAGRLVLMDVGDDSLHRVREVTRGLRVSLSGWLFE